MGAVACFGAHPACTFARASCTPWVLVRASWVLARLCVHLASQPPWQNGDLVWAQSRGHPFWPAVVTAVFRSDKEVMVHYYGEETDDRIAFHRAEPFPGASHKEYCDQDIRANLRDTFAEALVQAMKVDGARVMGADKMICTAPASAPSKVETFPRGALSFDAPSSVDVASGGDGGIDSRKHDEGGEVLGRTVAPVPTGQEQPYVNSVTQQVQFSFSTEPGQVVTTCSWNGATTETAVTPHGDDGDRRLQPPGARFRISGVQRLGFDSPGPRMTLPDVTTSRTRRRRPFVALPPPT